MQTDKNIPAIHEAMIVSGMSQCLDLIVLISNDPIRKETHIFVEQLALSLRELSFYVDKYFIKNLDGKSLVSMTSVKNIRDAICHRSSLQNLLSPNLHISGSFNFKDNDIEVQYGRTKIFLKEGMIGLYLQFRKTITDSKHFAFMKRHPSWNIEEQKLEKTQKSISINLNTKNVTAKMREKIKSW